MESTTRKIDAIIQPQAILEGAGVRVQRTIATPTLNYLDPFLLLDHFVSTRRSDYEAGFPLHPHRGIETVTYVLAGAVRHADTLGNSGTITAGDVQWMTSGRGIMHEEMPQVRPEGIAGFQLWVNLPAKDKMTEPRYQDVRSAEIVETQRKDGSRVRVIAGNVDGVHGPVKGIAADPIYMDVFVPPGSQFLFPVVAGHNAFAYVFEGEGKFGSEEAKVVAPRLVIFKDGDQMKALTGDKAVRFLLVSGKPLNEPVARYGPFVMNTREEIEETLEELRRGTFVR